MIMMLLNYLEFINGFGILTKDLIGMQVLEQELDLGVIVMELIKIVMTVYF